MTGEDFLQGNSWFDINYKPKMGLRYETVKLALSLFLQRGGHVILETGCQRLPDDWGDGKSTTIFGEFCNRYGKSLVSVDINPQNMGVAKQATQAFAANIRYIVSDSVKFLEGFNEKIGLLYLDSMDCPLGPADDPQLKCSQEHNLSELKAALKNLTEDTVILLDDNGHANGGKTKLTKEYLRANGWKEIMSNAQSLWSKR